MKRVYIILALAAMALVACEMGIEPQDRPVDDPSEINEEDIEDEEPAWLYDSYKGYDMPVSECYREDMEATLCLIDTQEGEVNDELFAEMLISKVMHFTEQYLTFHAGYWTSSHEWDGGDYGGSLMMMEDGTCYDHSYPGCAFIEFDAFLHEKGYKGTYYTTLWSYDAESHTLNTIYSPDYYNISMSAELLYFDGVEAVMVGHIAGVAVVGASRTNDYKTGIIHEFELYRFEFTDGRDTFLDGFASPEEYDALKEEWESTHPDYY